MALNLMPKKEVVVAGGGPAGIVASIAAARNGAKTMLVERYGFLGGEAATGLWLHNFQTRQGETIINGIPEEMVRRMVALGGSTGIVKGTNMHTYGHTPIDDETFKYVALEMIEEAGVELLLHSFISDVLLENSDLKGIIVESKSGKLTILADAFVDATGDGDVAFLAGVPYEKGRPEDGQMQSMTLMFRMGSVDIDKAADFMLKNGYLKGGYLKATRPGESEPSFMWFSGNFEAWGEEVRREKLFPDEKNIFCGISFRRGELNLNTIHVTKVDGTNVWDLTSAEIEGRKQARRIAEFLKKHVPGFESSYLLSTAVHIGVRETRRILGEYVLNESDILEGRKFSDVIARGAYPIDIHDPKTGLVTFEYIRNNGSYDIPYRCLVPQKVENLLIAGRCISTTHKALASTRVMAICMATGQAAGTAAALSVRNKIKPRELEIKELQKILREQGANLG